MFSYRNYTLICTFLSFQNEKVAQKNEKAIANDTDADQLDEEFEDSGYKLSTRLI